MPCPQVFPPVVCEPTSPVMARAPLTGTGLVASPIQLDMSRLRRQDAIAIMEALACSREAMTILCNALNEAGCLQGSVIALSPIVGTGSAASPLQIDGPAMCALLNALSCIAIATEAPVMGNGLPADPVRIDPAEVVCLGGDNLPDLGLLQCGL